MSMLHIKNIYWNKADNKSILEALKEGLFEVDYDFNGSNGLSFTSMEAQDRGFDSDIEYTVAKIIERDMEIYCSAESVVEQFLSSLFADSSYYEAWEFAMMEHPERGLIGVSVTWYA